MQDLRGRCPHLFTFAGTYADAMMLLIRKDDVIGVGHRIGECLGRFLHTYHQRWNGRKRLYVLLVSIVSVSLNLSPSPLKRLWPCYHANSLPPMKSCTTITTPIPSSLHRHPLPHLQWGILAVGKLFSKLAMAAYAMVSRTIRKSASMTMHSIAGHRCLFVPSPCVQML